MAFNMDVSSDSKHTREGEARTVLYNNFFQINYREPSLIFEIAPNVNRILNSKHSQDRIHCVFPMETMRSYNIDCAIEDLKTQSSNITYCLCPFPFHYKSCEWSDLKNYNSYSVIRYISVDHTYYVTPQSWIILYEFCDKLKKNISVLGVAKKRTVSINSILQLVPTTGLRERKATSTQLDFKDNIYCVAAGDTVNWTSPSNNISMILQGGYQHGTRVYSWAKSKFLNSMMLMTLTSNSNAMAPTNNGHHQQFESLYSITLPYTTTLDVMSMSSYRTYFIPEALVCAIISRLGSIVNSDPNTLAARVKSISVPGNPLAILHLSTKIMMILSNSFQSCLDEYIMLDTKFKMTKDVQSAVKNYASQVLRAFVGIDPQETIFTKFSNFFPSANVTKDYIIKFVKLCLVVANILDPSILITTLTLSALIPEIISIIKTTYQNWMKIPDRVYFEITDISNLKDLLIAGLKGELQMEDRIIYYKHDTNNVDRSIKVLAPEALYLIGDCHYSCFCATESKSLNSYQNLVSCSSCLIDSHIIPSYNSRFVIVRRPSVFHENPIAVVARQIAPFPLAETHIISTGHKNYVVKNITNIQKPKLLLLSNTGEDHAYFECECGFSSLMSGIGSWQTWDKVNKYPGSACISHDYDPCVVSDFPNSNCVFCRIGYHKQVTAPHKLCDTWEWAPRIGGIKVPYLTSIELSRDHENSDEYYYTVEFSEVISFSRDLVRLKYWKYGLFISETKLDIGDLVTTTKTGDLTLKVKERFTKREVEHNGPGKPGLLKCPSFDINNPNNSIEICERINFDEDFPIMIPSLTSRLASFCSSIFTPTINKSLPVFASKSVDICSENEEEVSVLCKKEAADIPNTQQSTSDLDSKGKLNQSDAPNTPPEFATQQKQETKISLLQEKSELASQIPCPSSSIDTGIQKQHKVDLMSTQEDTMIIAKNKESVDDEESLLSDSDSDFSDSDSDLDDNTSLEDEQSNNRSLEMKLKQREDNRIDDAYKSFLEDLFKSSPLESSIRNRGSIVRYYIRWDISLRAKTFKMEDFKYRLTGLHYRPQDVPIGQSGIFFDDVGYYKWIPAVNDQDYEFLQTGVVVQKKGTDWMISLGTTIDGFVASGKFKIKTTALEDEKFYRLNFLGQPSKDYKTLFTNITNLSSAGFKLSHINLDYNLEDVFSDFQNFELNPSKDLSWLNGIRVIGSDLVRDSIQHYINTGSHVLIDINDLKSVGNYKSSYHHICKNPRITRKETDKDNCGNLKIENGVYYWDDYIVKDKWQFSFYCECEKTKHILFPCDKEEGKIYLNTNGDYPLNFLPSCLPDDVGIFDLSHGYLTRIPLNIGETVDPLDISDDGRMVKVCPPLTDDQRRQNFNLSFECEPSKFKFPGTIDYKDFENPRSNYNLLQKLIRDIKSCDKSLFFDYLRLLEFCAKNVFSFGYRVTFKVLVEDGPGGSGKSKRCLDKYKDLCSFTRNSAHTNGSKTYQLYLRDLSFGRIKSPLIIDEGLMSPLEYIFACFIYKEENSVKLLSDTKQGIGGGNHSGAYSWFAPDDPFLTEMNDNITVYRYGPLLATHLKQTYYNYEFEAVGREIQICTYPNHTSLDWLVDFYNPDLIVFLSDAELQAHSNNKKFGKLCVSWKQSQGDTADTVLYYRYNYTNDDKDLDRCNLVALSRTNNVLIAPQQMVTLPYVMHVRSYSAGYGKVYRGPLIDGITVPAEPRKLPSTNRLVSQKFSALANILKKWMIDNGINQALELTPGAKKHLIKSFNKINFNNVKEEPNFVLLEGKGYLGSVIDDPGDTEKKKKKNKILDLQPYVVAPDAGLVILDINNHAKGIREDQQHAINHPNMPTFCPPDQVIKFVSTLNHHVLIKFNRPPRKFPSTAIWLIMDNSDTTYSGEEYYCLSHSKDWVNPDETINWATFPVVNPLQTTVDAKRMEVPFKQDGFITGANGSLVKGHSFLQGDNDYKFMYLSDFTDRIVATSHKHRDSCLCSAMDKDTFECTFLLGASNTIYNDSTILVNGQSTNVTPINFTLEEFSWKKTKVIYMNALHPRNEGPCRPPKNYVNTEVQLKPHKVLYSETFGLAKCLDPTQQRNFNTIVSQDDTTAIPYSYPMIKLNMPDGYIRNWKLNATNALISLEKRQFAYKHSTNPLVVAKYAEIARKEFQDLQKQGLVPYFDNCSEPTERNTWKLKFSPFRQKVYDRSKDETYDDAHFHETEVMCKADELGIYNIPRAISSFDTRAAYRSGPAADGILSYWKEWQKMNDHLKNEGPVFTSGMAGTKLARSLIDSQAIWGVDFTKFDSSLHYYLLREALVIIENAYTHKSWKQMIADFGIWKFYVRSKNNRRDKVTYHAIGTMLSGHPLTTLLNTIINMFTLCLAKKFQREQGLQHNFISFHVGDDTATPEVYGLESNYRLAATLLGLDAEIQTNVIPEYNSAYAVESTSGEAFMVPSDIRRALKRYYVRLTDKKLGKMNKFESYSCALQGSLDLNCFNGVPILYDIAKKITEKYGLISFSDVTIDKWLQVDSHSYDKMNNFHKDPLDSSYVDILLDCWDVSSDYYKDISYDMEQFYSKTVDIGNTLYNTRLSSNLNNNASYDLSFQQS